MINNINNMNNKVIHLLRDKTQIKQRTPEWYHIRKELITATDAASALEANPYKTKIELLKSKCEQNDNILTDASTNNAMNWGTKYEPVAIQLYEQFEKDKVYELGLLRHPKYTWLAASPDGIRLNGKLVEIKCVYNRKIRDEEPYMYWVQVQIQLEVCNLNECDLFQCKFYEFKDKKEYKSDKSNHKGIDIIDNKEFYWKLEEYSCKTIIRDKEWFNKSLATLHKFHQDIVLYKKKGFNKIIKRKRDSDEDETKLSKRTRSNSQDEYANYDWNKWVSATETKNFMLNDPLLDWLNRYGGKFNLLSDKKLNDKYDFNEYIRKKGIEFEKAIIYNLYKRFNNKIVNIANNYEGYSTEKLKKTIDAMYKGIPIIHHGVLHNTKNNTFGIPDIIIRSDYLNKLTECDNITYEESKHPSIFSNKWHYRIVEIKFTTLKIHNEYIHNVGNISSYKSQAIIYNEALATIQNYNPYISYLIGRKINIEDNKYIGFYKLGKIDYNNKDIKIKLKTDKAIEWVKKLKSDGEEWTINPPSLSELYPNMCNKADYPWHGVKKEIANKINDITMLWNCGTKNREIAFNNNVYHWKDKKCKDTLFGFSGTKGNIINNIIKINNKKTKKINVGVNKVELNSGKLQFYVDFETCSDINHNFDEYRLYDPQYNIECESKNNTLIYMIGIGWIHPITNKWVFKTFVTDIITHYYEKKIIKEWINYMKAVSAEFNNNRRPDVYHWSPAEVSCYNTCCDRYNIKHEIKWKDLLEIFKTIPITLNNVFNFGLKNIAKQMYKNKMITTCWEDNELDGLGAMVATWNSDDKIHRGRTNGINKKLKDFDEMKEIIKYNEIDCKVMWDIKRYISTKI